MRCRNWKVKSLSITIIIWMAVWYDFVIGFTIYLSIDSVTRLIITWSREIQKFEKRNFTRSEVLSNWDIETLTVRVNRVPKILWFSSWQYFLLFNFYLVRPTFFIFTAVIYFGLFSTGFLPDLLISDLHDWKFLRLDF